MNLLNGQEESAHSSLSPANFTVTYISTTKKNQSNVISNQSWACLVDSAKLETVFCRAPSPWVPLSREEMALSVLVCTGTWRLRTRQGWARDFIRGSAQVRTHVVIVMTYGQRIRRFSGLNGCKALREIGAFSAGNLKRGGEWQNAISLPVYSFWTWCSTGWVGPSSILIIPFVDSRPWAEQSRPLGMCPCGAGSQVGKKDIKAEVRN